jgi:hypothetical protein
MRAIVAILTALVLTSSVADPAEALTFHRDYPYVWRVNIGEDNYLWINVYANFTTEHGCNERWYARSKHDLSDDRTKALLQMAMASFLAQIPVHVWTEGCTGGGSTGYPILIQLQLQKP